MMEMVEVEPDKEVEEVRLRDEFGDGQEDGDGVGMEVGKAMGIYTKMKTLFSLLLEPSYFHIVS